MKKRKTPYDFKTIEQWDAYLTKYEAERKKLQEKLQNHKFQALHPPVTAVQYDGSNASVELIRELCYPVDVSASNGSEKYLNIHTTHITAYNNYHVTIGQYVLRMDDKENFILDKKQFEECYHPFPIIPPKSPTSNSLAYIKKTISA